MGTGYEWDPQKNAANIAKHFIDFETQFASSIDLTSCIAPIGMVRNAASQSVASRMLSSLSSTRLGTVDDASSLPGAPGPERRKSM